MHNHGSTEFSFPVDQMTAMWLLMGLMAIHHFLMWREMKKMKSTKKCEC